VAAGTGLGLGVSGWRYWSKVGNPCVVARSAGPRIGRVPIIIILAGPSFEASLARFRLMPAQTCENEFIVEFIERHSLMRVEGGWTWKFDPRIFIKFSKEKTSDYLASARCRVALQPPAG